MHFVYERAEQSDLKNLDIGANFAKTAIAAGRSSHDSAAKNSSDCNFYGRPLAAEPSEIQISISLVSLVKFEGS